MDRKEQTSYGDGRGTRAGAPARTRTPSIHSDLPSDRPERQTGAGAEATEGTSKTGDEHHGQHQSGYGGKGGEPVSSSDERQGESTTNSHE
jgi:hypothetical protein